MSLPKPESAKPAVRSQKAKAPYTAPRLEVLGSLRSATRGSGNIMGDGGSGMRMFSDRRLKEEIVRVGEHRLGLGIYRYRYKAQYAGEYGTGRRVGVMADEVAEKYPHAVCRSADGHLMVDYGLLFH
jgi:hypothetical protein